jgi:hypothetical protein
MYIYIDIYVPTVLTAAPSAKRPTVGSVTTLPALNDAVIPAASSASTPMILMSGLKALTAAAIPDKSPMYAILPLV